MFIGQFIPRLEKGTFWYLRHPASTHLLPHEDALMIKLFLVCLCRSVWRWAHPPYLLVSPSFSVCFTKLKSASKTNLKYAFSHANTRMFGNCSPQVEVTSGFAHCQGSANNKAEATSKIIKVSFLRTSIELKFHSGHLEDAAMQRCNIKDILWVFGGGAANVGRLVNECIILAKVVKFTFLHGTFTRKEKGKIL